MSFPLRSFGVGIAEPCRASAFLGAQRKINRQRMCTSYLACTTKPRFGPLISDSHSCPWHSSSVALQTLPIASWYPSQCLLRAPFVYVTAVTTTATAILFPCRPVARVGAVSKLLQLSGHGIICALPYISTFSTSTATTGTSTAFISIRSVSIAKLIRFAS